VLSVGKEINDPRYPSFMGIRKAGKAVIPASAVSDLGVAAGGGQTQWTNVRRPDERKTKVVMIDGASVQEKAAKLADALLAEKVI
jgi:electron transfer flavoprotein beta subunit